MQNFAEIFSAIKNKKTLSKNQILTLLDRVEDGLVSNQPLSIVSCQNTQLALNAICSGSKKVKFATYKIIEGIPSPLNESINSVVFEARKQNRADALSQCNAAKRTIKNSSNSSLEEESFRDNLSALCAIAVRGSYTYEGLPLPPKKHDLRETFLLTESACPMVVNFFTDEKADIVIRLFLMHDQPVFYVHGYVTCLNFIRTIFLAGPQSLKNTYISKNFGAIYDPTNLSYAIRIRENEVIKISKDEWKSLLHMLCEAFANPKLCNTWSSISERYGEI